MDDIARFVNPTTVVCALSEAPSDPNYACLQDNYQRLQAATDQAGRPLDVIPLPMPGLVGSESEPLPASYANFYIANGGIVMPSFEDSQDQKALDVVAGCFPDREVVQVRALDILAGGGGIHCITQQQPAVSD